MGSKRGTVAIVKTTPSRYPGILENEYYFMSMGKRLGLNVAKTQIEQDTLVVHRFVRIKRKGAPPYQMQVEGALQALDYYPLAKYSVDFREAIELSLRLRAPRSVQLDLL